jgi:hypothetical protein
MMATIRNCGRNSQSRYRESSRRNKRLNMKRKSMKRLYRREYIDELQ